MNLLLPLLSLVLPFAIWFGPALVLRRVARRNGLDAEEYLMLGLLLPWLAPFLLWRDIQEDRHGRRPQR